MAIPSLDYKGVICGMAAFKQHCAFGFWKAALIFDRDKAAEKTAMGNFGCLRSVADLPDEKILISYVKKAAALNEAGISVPGRAKPKKRPPLEVPDDFSRARNTFDNFAPSHRREYVQWITEAKREETRQKRLKTSIGRLAEGKPRHWKYTPAPKVRKAKADS